MAHCILRGDLCPASHPTDLHILLHIVFTPFDFPILVVHSPPFDFASTRSRPFALIVLPVDRTPNRQGCVRDPRRHQGLYRRVRSEDLRGNYPDDDWDERLDTKDFIMCEMVGVGALCWWFYNESTPDVVNATMTDVDSCAVVHLLLINLDPFTNMNFIEPFTEKTNGSFFYFLCALCRACINLDLYI